MQNQSPSLPQDDEIDLFELVAAVWKRKWIVAGVTAIVVALAIIYLVVTPKVYKADVFVGKTQAVNVTQLNVGQEQLGQYAQSVSPESAFELFQNKLRSTSLAMEYFKVHVEPVYRANGLANSDSKLLDAFIKSITVSGSDKNGTSITVALQYTAPSYTAEWLNGFLRYVEFKTKEELVDAANHNRLLAINEYEKEISSLRKIYNRRLQDKIILLEEAFSIAKTLNIQNAATGNLSQKVRSSELDESLLYMRGYEVLKAEIQVLKERKQVDPFIEDIRPIQERISYLDSVKYDISSLGVVHVDAWAAEPEQSIKPKRSLILVLAGLLGGGLGVLVSLVLLVVSKRKTG